MAATDDEIRRRFAHHPPSGPGVAATHEAIRTLCADTAVLFNRALPESREKSLALTALQEAAQWANAAVAIHMNKYDDGERLPGAVG